MEADTAEEAYVVAREAGFQGSTEDLQKAIQEELLKSSADELSDAELEAVVGGSWKSFWHKVGSWFKKVDDKVEKAWDSPGGQKLEKVLDKVFDHVISSAGKK